MKSLLATAGSLLALAGLTLSALPHAEQPVVSQAVVPVVVELFTSEGCSSCPSADAVLREVESSQPVPGAEIIALGQHVDYWNRLGWKDVFSDPAYTARQGQYAARFDNGSYTPQAVVQGHEELVGSRRTELLAAIGRAAHAPQAQVVLSSGTDGQPLQVRVSGVPASAHAAQVLLFITESDLATQVGQGENAGELLRHASVVRSLRSLGTVAANGTFAATPTLALASGWNTAHLRAVVVVQDSRTQQIVGAGALPLSKNLARQ